MDLNAVSDEDSLNDNASVISTESSGKTYFDASKWKFWFPLKWSIHQFNSLFLYSDIGDDPGDEVCDQNELFEDKLAEAIEGMSEKSAQSRVNSFESVAAALMKKFIPEFVNQRSFFHFKINCILLSFTECFFIITEDWLFVMLSNVAWKKVASMNELLQHS